MSVPLGELVAGLELLVVRVFDAQGFSDILHNVLVGRGIVAAGSGLAGELGILDIDIDVTAGDFRRHPFVLAAGIGQFVASGAGRRSAPFQVE